MIEKNSVIIFSNESFGERNAPSQNTSKEVSNLKKEGLGLYI